MERLGFLWPLRPMLPSALLPGTGGGVVWPQHLNGPFQNRKSVDYLWYGIS